MEGRPDRCERVVAPQPRLSDDNQAGLAQRCAGWPSSERHRRSVSDSLVSEPVPRPKPSPRGFGLLGRKTAWDSGPLSKSRAGMPVSFSSDIPGLAPRYPRPRRLKFTYRVPNPRLPCYDLARKQYRRRGRSSMTRPFHEAARFVCDSVERLGLSLSPSSRLMRMRRSLCKDDGSPVGFVPPDAPSFETVLEAYRDVQLLEFTFDRLPAGADAETVAIVRRLLRDSVLPEAGKADSSGRDAQVELFVAAVCRGAGLLYVMHAEPDVRCSFHGKPFGIAVKRIKTHKRFVDRVHEGAKQVMKAGLAGIVAVDTSLALNPNNERVRTKLPDDEFVRLWRQALTSFTATHHAKLLEAARVQGMLGVLVIDHQVRYTPSDSWALEMMTWRIPTVQYNQRRQRQFDTFVDKYLHGLPNLSRM